VHNRLQDDSEIVNSCILSHAPYTSVKLVQITVMQLCK